MESKKINEIRLAADLQTDSIVDGPGLRAVLWTQGCGHKCKGCQNPQTHDFNGGGLVPIDMVLEAIDELEKRGLNIWVYTGFTYEELMELAKSKPVYLEFLKNIDVLVDGRFILEQRDLSLLFRGSRNQRLIDVQKSLESGKVTLVNETNIDTVEEKFFKHAPMYI